MRKEDTGIGRALSRIYWCLGACLDVWLIAQWTGRHGDSGLSPADRTAISAHYFGLVLAVFCMCWACDRVFRRD